MTPHFKLEHASCTTEDESLMAGLEALLIEIERLRRHGVTASELERRKRATLSRYEGFYNRRNDTDSSTLTNELVRAATNGESVPGIAAEQALILDLMPTITLQELGDAAATWLAPGKRQFAVHMPASADLAEPSQSQVLAIAEGVCRSDVQPHIDAVSTGPLIRQRLVPGHITARRELPELGVVIWTLSNGNVRMAPSVTTHTTSVTAPACSDQFVMKSTAVTG
jgi:zinc protease